MDLTVSLRSSEESICFPSGESAFGNIPVPADSMSVKSVAGYDMWKAFAVLIYDIMTYSLCFGTGGSIRSAIFGGRVCMPWCHELYSKKSQDVLHKALQALVHFYASLHRPFLRGIPHAHIVRPDVDRHGGAR